MPGHEDIGAFQTEIGNTHPFATGSGDRNGDVQIYNADRTPRSSIKNPFPGFGNRVVVADLTGDGVAEVIVAAGRGARPRVAIFDGSTGAMTHEFMAFPKTFRGGLFVTTGDVNNDGISDIIVGQGAHKGSKGEIRVFSGTDLSLMMDFKAFDSGSAVSVAAADINGDGYADIIAMQGASEGASKLSVFDGHNLTRNITGAVSTMNPFGRKYHGGGYVTTGNVDGDGTPDIIVSQQSGQNPRISIFSGASKSLLRTFQITSSDGATVASRDFDNDGVDDIFTNVIRNHSSTMEVFSGIDNTLLHSWKTDSKTALFIG